MGTEDEIKVSEDQIEHMDGLLLGMGQRKDANETAFLARELEHVKTKTYDKVYPDFQARSLIPVDNSADPGAETITYYQYDEVASARLIANFSDDLPKADVIKASFSQQVYSYGNSYEYSILDVRRSAKAGGKPLEQRRADAARRGFEAAVDDFGAVGNASLGIKGLTNHASVPVVVFPHAGAWSTLTPTQIRANLNYLVKSIVLATKTKFKPNVLVLPTEEYEYIFSTTVDTTNQTTIGQAFLDGQKHVKEIVEWDRLTTAGAGGIRRVLCYFKSDEVLTFNIPQEFEQLPPQAKSLAFTVPCHGRIGGVEMHQPLACGYADVIV